MQLNLPLANHVFRLTQFNKRYLIVFAVLSLWLIPDFQTRVTGVLSDAFLQVSAFVAATLAIYYGFSHHLSTKGWQNWIHQKPYREIVYAGLMGILPGCGGAIVVITQYTRGQIGFGAVVAVLTSTMGDAAFLLISQRPQQAIIVLSISFLIGIVSGLITNRFLPSPAPISLTPNTDTKHIRPDQTKNYRANSMDVWISRLNVAFWCLLILPVSVVALLLAMQYNVNLLLGFPDQLIEDIGAIAGFTCLLLWALSAKTDSFTELTKENDNRLPKHWLRKVAQDTQFVTSWVVVAFLCFEFLNHYTGGNILSLIESFESGSVFFAALMGLLPGCGPQIMITGLYLQGAIPLSAQLANAISNDGDALFPAIALAPRAALLATLYSTVPALIAGYGYYWLFEM
ncbi:putative manganese transporter [Marinomonas sp. THO17]|uniref:putative manganese transporter n=1 Tax=Marinomonas sp. THO17 TaxID=3149048 RepID=UPI00336BBA64